MFEKLFAGEILSLDPIPASHTLAAWARAIVAEEFGHQPEHSPAEVFLPALTRARERVGGEEGRRLVAACLHDLGVPLEGLLLDAVRLRAVSPGLENVAAAAPAFYAHRDTWYGNPKAQINGWVPLHAVDGRNSFRFYLDDFDRVVANDSETFDADHFQARGGFGRTASDPVSAYPRALTLAAGRRWDVELPAAGMLFFSAAHLHQTLPNRTDKIRFSLDFRLVRCQDMEAGEGAPDPDNRSRGSFVSGYHLATWGSNTR